MSLRIDHVEEGNVEELSHVEEGNVEESLLQKLLAEVIGTYFLIFAGCGAVAVNKIYGSVSFPGVCITWGLAVMVLTYSIGHISGAHFNPAVTIAFALFHRFPLLQVPFYIVAQVLGSILASGTLHLMLDVKAEDFFGTVPVGSNRQSLAIEILISFLLVFVISGASKDNRAISELGGIATGMTILLNVLVAGQVSGASMNPAVIMNNYPSVRITSKSLQEPPEARLSPPLPPANLRAGAAAGTADSPVEIFDEKVRKPTLAKTTARTATSTVTKVAIDAKNHEEEK